MGGFDPGVPAHAISLNEELETHAFTSVGVDVGSATSHFCLSRLVIRRASPLSTEFVVSEREVLHTSPVWLTPYLPGGQLIDTEQLRRVIKDEYHAASYDASQIDTGAVVITGEALKKANAQGIARMMASLSGRFVCVSAGPSHEALLAAHGSGSVILSRASGHTVLNVDVGGGTTKMSLIREGSVRHIESVSIGARLVAFEANNPGLGSAHSRQCGSRIVRWETPATVLADYLGLDGGTGHQMSSADRRRLACLMADVLAGRISGESRLGSLYERLLVSTDGYLMPPMAEMDHIVFSGGVAEYMAPHSSACADDLGYLLARALEERVSELGLAGKVHPATQRIRATVLGASEFSVQASSQTVYVSDPSALPVRGLRAVEIDASVPVGEGEVRAALRRLDLEQWSADLAAVVRVAQPVSYPLLFNFASALAATARSTDPSLPIYVVVRLDVARALGRMIKNEVGWPGPVVVVDGIAVGGLDHLDIGTQLGRTGALPVTVTSLHFPASS